MSQRKIIREKIRDLLLDKTTCGTKVFENRMDQWWPENLPAISIYTRNETAEIWNVAPRKYKRRLSLSIEIVAKASGNVDDSLDLICDEVEAVMHGDDTLGGTCDDVVYQSTSISIVEDGEKLFSVARMDYEISYASYHGVNPATLPEIKKHHYELKSGESKIESDITLEE